jgi:hypothetical protein
MRGESTPAVPGFRLGDVRLVLPTVVALAAVAASSWQVRVGEGIAGVRLGMTQGQVAARIGKPYGMSIATRNVTCGMYARNDDFGACFDTRTGRVVSLSGIGSRFCVVTPRFCFQRVGGLAKLKRAFGRRLVGPVRRGEDPFYEVVVRRGGARVQSAFVVDTQSPPPYRRSAIVAVYIGYCGRQGSNVPPCPRRR